MTTETHSGGRRVPWPLVVLGVVFLGPLVGAWLLFGNVDAWRPPSSHYGTLVEPALPPGSYGDALPVALTPGLLRGHWTLLLVVRGPHDQQLARLLHDLHQLHAALGKHRDRVRRVALSELALPAATPAGGDMYAERIVVTAAAIGRLQARLPGEPGAPRALYLVDPLGNVMMHYPLPVVPRGVLDDLRRLLRSSRLG
ncbi:MAG TPA: hypothetical protein VIX81_01885 [Gammaproteobacteria bacterium]